MFFSFIKYISPTWYFNLEQPTPIPYILDYNQLTDDEKNLIDFDGGYTSENISMLDAAYQAFQKGIIKQDESYALAKIDNPAVADNYRFVKKYFHPFWAFYILCIRLFSFKNPLTELRGFFRSMSVKKISLFEKTYQHSQFESFNSHLLNGQPFVSVIIPTLNRHKYLKDVLRDMENQTYKNFEVLVYDQSTPFNAAFYENWNLDLKVVNQKERALWLARNTAIENSKGELILLYDDDSLVENDWIENHIKCLDYFKVDISSEVSISVAGAKVPRHYSFFRWSDQVDTGNVMVKKDVFRKTGMFDRQFEKQRQGDGEFGLRAYLAGFKNISNPYSKRIHLKVSEGGLREMGSWDAFRPKELFAPRPVPSVLYLTRKYFGNKAGILSILKNVPPSVIPYRYKRNKYLFLYGILFTILIFPAVLFFVVKSWRMSSKMLRQGHKIAYLKN